MEALEADPVLVMAEEEGTQETVSAAGIFGADFLAIQVAEAVSAPPAMHTWLLLHLLS